MGEGVQVMIPGYVLRVHLGDFSEASPLPLASSCPPGSSKQGLFGRRG